MKELTINQIRENIKFIENEDDMEKVEGGYSEALKYKIVKKNKSFFLKIMKNRENALERIDEILKVYKETNIDTVKLVDCGILKDFDLYYYIYDWIEGTRLDALVDEKDTKYFYKIGKEIGKKIKKLKETKIELKFINQVDDLSKKVNDWFGLLEAVPDEVVYRYLTKAEVQDIKQKMLQYTKYFDEKDKCIVHTDIKMGNTMITGEKIYIIDIEGTEYDYDVFNILCWPVGIFQETRRAECDRAFQKGFFEGFDLKRKHLDKQLLFMYMAKFCFSTYAKYTRKEDIDFLKLYKIAYDKTDKFTKLKEEIF